MPGQRTEPPSSVKRHIEPDYGPVGCDMITDSETEFYRPKPRNIPFPVVCQARGCHYAPRQPLQSGCDMITGGEKQTPKYPRNWLPVRSAFYRSQKPGVETLPVCLRQIVPQG